MDYPLYRIRNLCELYEDNKIKEFTSLLKEATDLLTSFVSDGEKFLDDVLEYLARIKYYDATIIGLYDYAEIAGAAIVAKNEFDSKGSTLYGKNAEIVAFGILDQHLGRNTSDELAEHALRWLGCTKPLCIVTPKMMNSIQPVIKDYDWKITESDVKNGMTIKTFNSYTK